MSWRGGTVGKYVRPLARCVALLVLGAGLAAVGACGADPTAEKDKSHSTSTTAASSTTGAEGGSRIPQPVVPGDLPTAPESERVDLAMPSFSDPTNVTNPLFPVSKQESVLLLGHVDGKPFRTEVTLLPETRIIEWQGQQVETLVSQYVANLDGRIHEVAYDLYAQADDGSVWYFGEDVFNFEDGVIVDTHGTWIAGKDGPAAMIMPADPKVGDVYRPENIPGFVFEEVTVKATGKTVDGPRGRVKGAIVVGELHMDGKREAKTFAPGYGEFSTGARNDIEAIALADPTDARTEPVPRELETLLRGARGSFSQPGSAITRQLTAAWNSYRTKGVPPLLEEQTD